MNKTSGPGKKSYLVVVYWQYRNGDRRVDDFSLPAERGLFIRRLGFIKRVGRVNSVERVNK